MQQSQVVPQVSDYESDINYLSDIAPRSSNRTDEEFNLAVLKRHDPTIITLEHVASYAVVYLFSPSSQQWVKSGIEGSAFVCGLAPTQQLRHRYSVIVLNRRGLDNFRADLSNAGDVEVTEEYIILQSSKDGIPQVYGLWVFCEPPPSSTSHQREAIAQKIQECAARAEESRGLAEGQLNGHDGEANESVPMVRVPQPTVAAVDGDRKWDDLLKEFTLKEGDFNELLPRSGESGSEGDYDTDEIEDMDPGDRAFLSKKA